MKIIKFILPILFLSFGFTLSAVTFTSANITYTSLSNDEVEVSGYSGTPQNLSIPQEITYSKVKYRVASISERAFRECSSLKEITIPETIRDIGDDAFYGCSNLKNISIPYGVKTIGIFAFYNCSSLTSIVIEDAEQTIEIGLLAFENIGNLEHLYIGRNIKHHELYESPFHTQLKLTEIEFGKYVTEIPQNLCYEWTSLANCELPPSLEKIGSHAFYGCSSLLNISFPETLIEICYGAFSQCVSLGEINLPSRLKLIDSCAFEGCPLIKELRIPGSVVSIGLSAFAKCPQLISLIFEDADSEIDILSSAFENTPIKTIYLGRNVTHAAISAFEGQTDLKNLTIGNSVTKISQNLFENCSGICNLKIPSSVILIEEKAFYNCTSLSDVEIEDGSDEITVYEWIFYQCPIKTLHLGRDINFNYYHFTSNEPSGMPFYYHEELQYVTLGETVTKLPSFIFYKCSGLLSINIPSSVEYIGSPAFDGCSSLANVIFEDGETPITIEHLKDVEILFASCALESVYLGRSLIFPTKNGRSYSPFENQKSLVSAVIADHIDTIQDYLFYGCSSLSDLKLPPYFTEIGKYSFAGCSSLTSFTIPNSVSSVGENAISGSSLSSVTIEDSDNILIFNSSMPFGSCPSLETIYIGRDFSIPENPNQIFLTEANKLNSITFGSKVSSLPSNFCINNSSLKQIIIPATINSIGKSAFYRCISLSSVTIENSDNSLTIPNTCFESCPLSKIYIGRDIINPENISPFYGMKYLEEIVLSENVINLPERFVESCSSLRSIELPQNLTSIPRRAFNRCESLESISIPNKVISIGASAFSNCHSLALINLPESLQELGGLCFSGCSSLAIDNIPISVQSIGSGCFNGCSSIETMDIKAPITALANLSFAKCTNLKNINLPESIKVIGSYAFQDCESLKKIIIPSTVTEIGSHAFSDCFALTTAHLPEDIIRIEEKTFLNCTSLTEIDIPNSVVAIADSAFYNCSSIQRLSLGKSVETIGEGGFYNCQKLETICSLNTTPPLVKNSTFYGVDKTTCKLAVPQNCLVFYSLYPVWKDFINISEIEEEMKTILSPIPEAIYGDSPINLKELAPEGINFTYTSANPEIAIIEGNLLIIVGAGETEIIAECDNSEIQCEGLIRSFIVSKKELTIKVEDITIKVDDEIPEFVLTAKGLAYDDSLEDVGELPVAYCDALQGSVPGVYPIYLQGGESKNYNLILVSGTLTILETEYSRIEDIPGIDLNPGNIEELNWIKAYDYKGVLLYEGPEYNMELSPGIYIIDKGYTSKKVVVR